MRITRRLPNCVKIPVTCKDANFRRVSNLKGRVIAFGDREAMVGDVPAKSLLREFSLPAPPIPDNLHPKSQVLAEGRLIPSLPIAVRRDLAPVVVRRLRQLSTGLAGQPGGSAVVTSTGIQRIDPAENEESTRVHELAEETDEAL